MRIVLTGEERDSIARLMLRHLRDEQDAQYSPQWVTTSCLAASSVTTRTRALAVLRLLEGRGLVEPRLIRRKSNYQWAITRSGLRCELLS